MRFKTIVAILQNEQDAERVLDCAIPLADRFESHLIGIHAEALGVHYGDAADPAKATALAKAEGNMPAMIIPGFIW